MSHSRFKASKIHSPFHQSRARRRGVAVVYTALGLVALLGAGAITLDFSVLQSKRIQAQKAADAAALAGAIQLSRLETLAVAEHSARTYAQAAVNGSYTDGWRGDKVTITYPALDDAGQPRSNWYRVDLSRNEPTFFAKIFNRGQVRVGTFAVAQFQAMGTPPAGDPAFYGQSDGPTNLALFGPDARYSNGDRYSARTLNDGTANPDYNGKGYDFRILVPDNITRIWFEVFDPDCYNNTTEPGAVTEANYAYKRVDEYRAPGGGSSTNEAHRTTTRFTLYWDKNTPDDISDDQEIGQVTYGGTSDADKAADFQWNTLFNIRRSDYPDGDFRMNVTTISGSSENGFLIRAGKSRRSGEEFNSNNGTKVNADGRIPINFNQSGSTTISMGLIPTSAAGGSVTFTNFDTDINDGRLITFRCDSLPGQEFPGKLSRNGEWVDNQINLPANYTAGTWTATYEANVQDTTVWELAHTGMEGRPGSVKLVR